MADGYLIGEALLAKLRDIIKRVEEDPRYQRGESRVRASTFNRQFVRVWGDPVQDAVDGTVYYKGRVVQWNSALAQLIPDRPFPGGYPADTEYQDIWVVDAMHRGLATGIYDCVQSGDVEVNWTLNYFEPGPLFVANAGGGVLITNNTEETMPPFAVGELQSQYALFGLNAIVKKPSADDMDPSLLVINGSKAIPAWKQGYGFMNGPMPVAIDVNQVALPGNAQGRNWGTKAGEWVLKPTTDTVNRIGFRYINSFNFSNEVTGVRAAWFVNRYRALTDVSCVNNAIVGVKPAAGTNYGG